LNKYEQIMLEIDDFLDGTWLSQPNHGLLHENTDPIKGATLEAIHKFEEEIGHKLPISMIAWYQYFGEIPPHWNSEHDADFSLRDLRRAQEIAHTLTKANECKWELSNSVISFSQRLDSQFLFVDIGRVNADDPPVFHYMELDAYPDQTAPAFSTFIRETWLSWLDFPEWDKEVRRYLSGNSHPTWMERKKVFNEYERETRKIRWELIDQVCQEDAAKDSITGPRAFQERWIDKFSQTETWKKFQNAGLRMPFGWITPPIFDESKR
jgi:SMI1 / KNR4 family (SUKH-1)